MNRSIAIRCGVAAAAIFIVILVLSAGPASYSAPPKPGQAAESTKPWVAPDPASIPAGPLGDTIRLGRNVFNDTPKYAEKYVGNKLACTHCHIGGGTVSYGIPIVGLPGIFPMWRDREKTVITFEERIEQCFQRSESGHRVPNTDPIMVALVAYSQWLSKDQVTGHPFPGRGLVSLPELTGDAGRGSKIYGEQCETCHGPEGAGKPPLIPALWGPDSYTDGAGMYQVPRMAAFIQHNMPQSAPDTLTPQESYDVAAYVHTKPHTPFVMKDHM
jgi:thiosulfate dehydrogenase